MTQLTTLTLTGGGLIAAIMLLRWLGLERAPKRLLAALWLAVAARLLIPFSLTVKLPREPILQARTAIFDVLANVAGDRIASSPSAPRCGIQDVLAVVWLVGCAILLGFYVRAELRFRRKLTQSELPTVSDEMLTLRRLKAEYGIRAKLRLRRSEAISSPLVCGLLRPTVCLPSVTTRELELQLRHELTHVRRLDLLSKRVFVGCAILHWFNPLVWLMLRRANRDIELACDEAVLHRNPELRRAYALVLLACEEQKLRSAAAFGAPAISERIENIMNKHKFTALGAIFFVLLAACCAISFISAEIAPTPAAEVLVAGIKPTPLESEVESGGAYSYEQVFALPLDGEYEITLGFGEGETPLERLFGHDGIDLACEMNSPISAVKSGEVSEVGYDSERGNYVVIDHGDGLTSEYHHCSRVLCAVGDPVELGEEIARVGQTGSVTGPNLHFALYLDGKPVDVTPLFE